MLPLVDGLWCPESEGILQVPHGQAGLLSQKYDILSRFCHINGWDCTHFIFLLLRHVAGTRGPRSACLKVINWFHHINDLYGISDDIDDVLQAFVCHWCLIKRRLVDRSGVDARHGRFVLVHA